MRIDKDVALVTSGGRTATSFFGMKMDAFVSDCWSTHEPDVWRGIFNRRSWTAVRWFGAYHVVLGKVLRRTGMRCLTERYISGDWSADETAEAMKHQRERFYQTRPASLVVESNWQLFGLLPLLPKVLPSYRVLAIVRDPRRWVGSWVNFGGHHDEQDMVRRMGLPRMSPGMMGDERWSDRWSDMDSFERLCWDWRLVTLRLVTAARKDPRVRLVRFEDLFEAEDRRTHFEASLGFLTDFGERSYDFHLPPTVYETRVNASPPGPLGSWSEWPDHRRRFLIEMCGSLMKSLGYAMEYRPSRGPFPPPDHPPAEDITENL